MWTIVGLYILLTTLTHIPQVQRFIGQEIASALSAKLGTKVGVGRVDIGLFNRIIIDDIVIYDQQQRKMVKASRLSVKVDLLPLAQGRISISTAQLFGAHLALYKSHADSPTNFQFMLDSLASRDTTKSTPLDLRVNTFIMRHSSLQYDQLDVAPTAHQLNPAHLNISDISAHIILKAFREDSLNLTVKKLAFREQSGLQVDRMSLHAAASQHQASIEDFVLSMPHSKLMLGSLTANYQLQEGQLVPHSLHYKGSVEPSRITLSDIECLLPSLKAVPNEIVMATAFSGTDTGLDVNNLQVSSSNGDIYIDANGYIHRWDESPVWLAQLRQFEVSKRGINVALQQLRNNVSVPEVVDRLGGISIHGEVSGEGRAVRSHANMVTDVGQFSLNADLNEHRQLHGHIETDGLLLNELLADESFGTASMNLDVQGVLPAGGTPQLSFQGSLPRFDFRGYQYQGVQLDASYAGGDVDGSITIDDPNISLTAEGLLQRVSTLHSPPSYNVKLTANVTNCSPHALNLLDKWPDTQFAADINADFTASNLNDATGFLDISQFSMRSAPHSQPSTSYHLDNLHMETGYDEDEQHYVTLASDFASANLRGTFDYATLVRSITNLVATHLPTLPGLPEVEPTANNFAFNLHVRRSDFLTALFGVPLQLVSPLTMTGYVNDKQDGISLNGACPNFIYSGGRYSGGRLQVSTSQDSLLCNVSVVKHMDDNTDMTLGLNANAVDNNLTASFRWDNHEPMRMSGILNAKGRFFLNEAGQQEGAISVLPSQLTVNNAEWSVKPADITYSKENLVVHHFSVAHDQQHITIDGHASSAVTDTLTADLHDVDLEYVLDLVNFHSVDFSGLTSGRAAVSSLFATPHVEAQLKVRDFKFEHGRMGTLSATARWNTEKEQIDIHAISNDGPDAITYIDGFVAPAGDGQIDLNIKALGTHLDFAQSFASAFSGRVEGQGQGNLRIHGPLDAINLTGAIVVDGEMDITQLGTTYKITHDSIWFEPDLITCSHAAILDRDGHTGYVDGRLMHHNLSHWTFDIGVTADNLLAYDFTDFGDMNFYGTVYGSGQVDIKGRPGSIVFDIDVDAQPNSTFVYNASQPDAINRQEFIRWTAHEPYKPHETYKPDEPSTLHQNIPPPSPDEPSSDMVLNFLVHCSPSSTVRLLMDARTGDYISLNGEGSFRASYYNKGTFNMFGTYVVDRGTYNITIQELIKKNFTFQQGGTISFNGNPFNAQLNLQAQHTVNSVSLSDLNVGRSFSSNTVRVNCLMNIGGTAGAPQVGFDLSMPTVSADEQQMVRSVINGQQEMNQQVIYLLAVGRFYPQTDNNQSADGQSQQSQTALAMQSLLSGTLSSQLNALLSRVVNSSQWSFGTNISTGDEGWRNAEYEGLLSGRLLNNRLLLNGQFGYRDNANTATTSFIGDFDVQYLLTPSGSIAIKMYNQTNDRYFTRSSLNTQGLGIILKKDFTSLADLFGLRRRRQPSTLDTPPSNPDPQHDEAPADSIKAQ
ncbi:MAG: translocation/assembly module TamB [Prevotella sp.]|nr:translocation/assembly module TamB [Prevotella sp.]